MRICFLCLDTFGDLVLREPLVSAAVEQGHEVAVVARERYAHILPHVSPAIRAITTRLNPYSPGAADTWVPQLRQLLTDLLQFDPHMLICANYNRTFADDFLLRALPNASTAAFDGPGASAQSVEAARQAVGPRFFAHAPERPALRIRVEEGSHETQKYAVLAKRCLGNPALKPLPRLSVGSDGQLAALARLADLGLRPHRYVVCCPSGSMNVGTVKQTPEELVTSLSSTFTARGLAVLLVGVECERDHIERIARALALAGVVTAPWIGADGTLPELLGLIHYAAAYAGADTGPMHFAGALGRPVLCFYGGGYGRRFLPVASSSVVVTQELACWGCRWLCLFDRPACIAAVRPEIATQALERLLDGQVKGVQLETGAQGDLANAIFVGQVRQQIGSLRLERAHLIQSVRRDTDPLDSSRLTCGAA